MWTTIPDLLAGLDLLRPVRQRRSGTSEMQIHRSNVKDIRTELFPRIERVPTRRIYSSNSSKLLEMRQMPLR